MVQKAYATLTSKGQITVPAELRKRWNLKAGDQIAFEATSDDQGTIKPRRRRSIFERLDELQLPSIGRPLTQTDIDESIVAAIEEKFGKGRSKAAR